MNVSIPQNWGEIKPKQLINIAPLLHEENINLVKIFFALILLKWYKPKDWLILYRLTNVPASELSFHVRWLLEDKPPKRWMIHQFKGLVGPDLFWHNITWLEFTVADSLFCRYHETKDLSYARSLSATLFRKKGVGSIYDPKHADFTGDERRPFNTHITTKLEKRINAWSDAFHYAVVLNYAGVRRKLEFEFERVFDQDNEGAVIDAPKGWKPVTLSVSGEKFGNLKETERSPFREVLRHLEMNAYEIERLKENHGRD
jgi:hypothetical protein